MTRVSDPRAPRPTRTPSACVVLALLLLLASGCAVARPEHRHALAALDAHAAPDATAARWALVPLALPVGVVGWVVDSFLVNPVLAADDAWSDTLDLLWTSHHESTFRRILWVPFALVATPVVLVGDWLGRWLFPIPSREAWEREQHEDRRDDPVAGSLPEREDDP